MHYRNTSPLVTLAVAWLSLAVVTTHGLAETNTDTDWVGANSRKSPVSVRLLVPDDQPLIQGIQAENAQVIVRNNSENQVVAIRGAHWWEGGVASINWHGPVQGASSESNAANTQPDGSGIIIDIEALAQQQRDQQNTAPDSVSLNRTVAAMTTHWFERGVLLPGEQLAIPLPFTPQQYPTNTLTIEFVVRGDEDTDWRQEVLVPGPPPRYAGEVYVSPDDKLIQSRQQHGSTGLLYATMNRDAEGPRLQSAHFDVPIPTEAEYDLSLTGGITREEAAGRAGATIEEMNHLGFYLPKMKTWFFLGADEITRTLRFENGKWTFDFGLNMPAFAPELFGRGDKPTYVLINPDVFGHLVEANTPSEDRYYDPGLTALSADQLWQVLDYGRKKKAVELDAVLISPNGIAKQWVLTLAVKVDAAGRWEHPQVSATQPATKPSQAKPPPPPPPIRKHFSYRICAEILP